MLFDVFQVFKLNFVSDDAGIVFDVVENFECSCINLENLPFLYWDEINLKKLYNSSGFYIILTLLCQKSKIA